MRKGGNRERAIFPLLDDDRVERRRAGVRRYRARTAGVPDAWQHLRGGGSSRVRTPSRVGLDAARADGEQIPAPRVYAVAS